MADPLLIPVAPEIWIAEGEPVPFFTIPYPTRMAIVRLASGELWVWSPIQLHAELVEHLSALGRVRHLVAPNKLHHLFLSDWARAYPDALLYAPPGLARKRRDLHFHASLGDRPEPAWAADIDQLIFHGSLVLDEVVFFHRRSRSLIVCDLIQKFEPASLGAFQRLLMRLDGMLGPDGSTPREWRLSFWNRRAARSALRKALCWNPERIVIAHGTSVRAGGREALARSMRWLRPDP